MLVLCSACCKDKPTTPDATPAGPMNLRVMHLAGELPTRGLAVSVADAAGTPVQLLATDDNGAVEPVVSPGFSITVAIPAQTAHTFLATVLAVNPGDEIVIDDPVSSATAYGSIDVTLAAAVPGAGGYRVVAACDTRDVLPASTTTLQLTSECLTADHHYSVLAWFHDAASRPVAYATAFDLVAPGPNRGDTLALGSWRTDFDVQGASITAVPGGTAKMQLTVGIESGPARPFQTMDLVDVVSSGGVAASVNIPKGSWSGFRDVVTLRHINGRSQSSIIRNSGSLTGLDAYEGAELLPYVHDVALAIVPGGAAPGLEWVSDGPLDGATGILGRLSYTGTDVTVDQVIALPPSSPSHVDLPALPDELAALRFVDAGATTPSMIAVAGGNAPDAKAFREHFWDIANNGLSVSTGEVGRTSSGH